MREARQLRVHTRSTEEVGAPVEVVGRIVNGDCLELEPVRLVGDPHDKPAPMLAVRALRHWPWRSWPRAVAHCGLEIRVARVRLLLRGPHRVSFGSGAPMYRVGEMSRGG